MPCRFLALHVFNRWLNQVLGLINNDSFDLLFQIDLRHLAGLVVIFFHVLEEADIVGFILHQNRVFVLLLLVILTHIIRNYSLVKSETKLIR